MSRSDRFETFQHDSGRWQVVGIDPKPDFAAQGATEAEALLALADELMRALEDAESRRPWPDA